MPLVTGRAKVVLDYIDYTVLFLDHFTDKYPKVKSVVQVALVRSTMQPEIEMILDATLCITMHEFLHKADLCHMFSAILSLMEINDTFIA
ncbi:hypothetical protein PG997_009452 [Apiospora hydei]|uniref:Uncharacterized protein n=1 Tax=Apiospora hydei TaxID=1337664 RepID=A0ABR1VU58_9PEZI